MPSKNSMTPARFIGILSQSHWRTTEQMVDLLDRNSYWNEEEAIAEAMAKFKKDYVRRMVRTLKTESGDKVFINVKRRLPDGDEVQVYKQETLFDVNDYRYAVNYYKTVGIHYMAEANRLARNAAIRLNEQMPLPFPEFAAESPVQVPDLTQSPIGPVH